MLDTKAMASLVFQADGFTINPRTGEVYTSGYAVVKDTETERVIGGFATAEDFTQYAYDHATALASEYASLTAWYDFWNGQTHLYVTERCFGLGRFSNVRTWDWDYIVVNIATGVRYSAHKPRVFVEV